MGAGQNAHLAFDLAHGAGIPAVNPDSVLQDLTTNDIFFQFFHHVTDRTDIRILG